MNKKNTIVSLLLLVCCEANLKNEDTIEEGNYTTYSDMTFESKIIDMGKISEGHTLVGEFKFSNNSVNELIIEYVNPDCTCTEYSLSEKKIQPGKSGLITLVLDTNGKSGTQKIYAVVRANTKSKFHRLLMKAEVVI